MTLRQVPCEHTRKNGKEAIGLKYKLQYLENQHNLKQGKKIMDRLYINQVTSALHYNLRLDPKFISCS